MAKKMYMLVDHGNALLLNKRPHQVGLRHLSQWGEVFGVGEAFSNALEFSHTAEDGLYRVYRNWRQPSRCRYYPENEWKGYSRTWRKK